MERLDACKILAEVSLSSQSLLGDIHVFDELDSTSSWLLKHRHCGDVCLAEKQLKGRGRRGNSWSSPDIGNVYLSLNWCFASIPKYTSLLSLITGISICESLQSMGLQGHGLKWPNDVYIDDNKLGGILIESIDNLHTVVIGIGLNLYANRTNSWSHLEAMMDVVPDRNTLIARILEDLLVRLDELEELVFAEFKQAWLRWDIVSGRNVRVLQAGAESQEILGIAKGIDERGCILVELNNNNNCNLQAFHSAEISLRW